MPAKNGLQEKSIVNIVQNMLQSGESADKILATLKEMGITDEQSKTLLMMAQTNTFAVLQGDIKQQVSETIEQKLPDYENDLANKITELNKASQETIKTQVLQEADKKEHVFEEKVQGHVDKMLDISVDQDKKIDLIKGKLDDLGANYAKTVLGSTKWLFKMRIAAFVVGLGIAGFLIYKISYLSPGYSIDYLIFYIVLGIVAAILLVLSLI